MTLSRTRNRLSIALFAAVLTCVFPTLCPAAEPIPHAQKKPPGPALSPAEAMAKMELPQGFKVECVASEPELVNPTAFTFDDRGRIWVTESLEYPRKSAGPGKDRVKILEDADGDGKVEKVTIFKEGLNIPCGIVHGNGGVYVTNAPDVLFLKDTDGDDKADTQEVILTGFGRDDTHELPNSLTWGPDGWLYGMNGVFNQATVKDPASDKVYRFTCAIWRYHPPTKRFELFSEGTSNPWGLDYNRAGDWFLSCCVIDHLFHMTQSGYYHRQGGPYPPNVQMAKLPSIVTEKHQQAAYAGLCIYDADVFPEEFRGRLLMGNLHGSAINQDIVTRKASTYTQRAVKDADPNGKNKPDEQTRRDEKGNLDFLQANDAWFMPVAQKVGPDGCLYIMDWYDRYHCYQDANRDASGIDRLKGRIYRISYGDAPRAKPFDLAKQKSPELLKMLDSPNVWWRRTAQRVLSERMAGDERAANIAELNKMAFGPALPNNGHMHALWTLVTHNALPDDGVMALLNSDDEARRNWGARAIGNLETASPAQLAKLTEMAKADPSPAVRVQVAVAAGRLRKQQGSAIAVLLSLLADPANAKDPLIPSIAYLNLRQFAGEEHGENILDAIANLPGGGGQAFGDTTVRWIKQAIATSDGGARAVVASVEKALRGQPKAAELEQLLGTLIDALAPAGKEERQRALGSLNNVSNYFGHPEPGVAAKALTIALWKMDEQAIPPALKLVADPKPAVEHRIALAKTLAEMKARGYLDAFVSLARDNEVPIRLRQLAVDTIGSANRADAATTLVKGYAAMPAELKPYTINALTRSKASAAALVAALADKRIALSDVNANHVRSVLALNDADLAKAMTEAWGTVKSDRDPERVKTVEQMRKVVQANRGDVARGWAAFNKTCAACHTIYGRPGGNVGPDLTGVGRDDLTAVLTNVLDPNLVIGKPYYVHVARTKAGDVISGLLVEETLQGIVLRDQTGNKPIARGDLEKLTVQNVSMMPEGLEKGMTEQEFADLVAFLLTREPPTTQQAR